MLFLFCVTRVDGLKPLAQGELRGMKQRPGAYAPRTRGRRSRRASARVPAAPLTGPRCRAVDELTQGHTGLKLDQVLMRRSLSGDGLAMHCAPVAGSAGERAS